MSHKNNQIVNNKASAMLFAANGVIE